MQKALRVRIYPNREQVDLLLRSFGCVRFVWNHTLAKISEEYRLWKEDDSNPKPNVSQMGLTYLVKPLRHEFEWLTEVSAVPLSQKLRDLGQAYSNFFNGKGKVGHPQFKSRRGKQSIRLMTNAFSLKENRFTIAKCKTPIKVKWTRDLPSEPSQVTISRTPDGKYYASFLCEYVPARQCGQGILGIDLGLKDLYVDSNGNKHPNPRHLLSLLKQLQRLSRQHAKKQKGSKNKEKSRLKLARLHARIAHIRQDLLHQISARLVRENQAVVLEDLNVQGMMQNRRLARAIGDVSWGTLITYLLYKVKETDAGRMVVINRYIPSSHLCSHCKVKLDRKLTLAERSWVCPVCETTHDRDVNAAVNIRDIGELTLGIAPTDTPLLISPHWKDLIEDGHYRVAA